jgi:hypothetical protein
MAGVLWASYKERLGRSEDISMKFDLHQLISKVDGLDALMVRFEKMQPPRNQ